MVVVAVASMARTTSFDNVKIGCVVGKSAAPTSKINCPGATPGTGSIIITWTLWAAKKTRTNKRKPNLENQRKRKIKRGWGEMQKITYDPHVLVGDGQFPVRQLQTKKLIEGYFSRTFLAPSKNYNLILLILLFNEIAIS